MNLFVQKVFLRPNRTSKDLAILVKFMKSFNQFACIEEIPNYHNILLDLMGFFSLDGQSVYEEGDDNDEMVYYVIQGEAGAVSQNTGGEFKFREGDNFGSYGDQYRLESVHSNRDSFYVKIHRNHHKLISEQFQDTNRMKQGALQTLFPSITQMNQQSMQDAMLNLGYLVNHLQGDMIVKSNRILRQQTSFKSGIRLPMEDLKIFILINGACEISTQIKLKLRGNVSNDMVSNHINSNPNHESITHKICSAEPIFAIGDETLLDYKQWNNIMDILPLKFDGCREPDTQLIDYHYTAKVVSKTAKFLVYRVRDIIDRFPEQMYNQYVSAVVEKHSSWGKDLKQFLNKMMTKMTHIGISIYQPPDELNLKTNLSHKEKTQYMHKVFSQAVVMQPKPINVIVKRQRNTVTQKSIEEIIKISQSQLVDRQNRAKKRIISQHNDQLLLQNILANQGRPYDQGRNLTYRVSSLHLKKIPLENHNTEPDESNRQSPTKRMNTEYLVDKIFEEIFDFNSIELRKKQAYNTLIHGTKSSSPKAGSKFNFRVPMRDEQIMLDPQIGSAFGRTLKFKKDNHVSPFKQTLLPPVQEIINIPKTQKLLNDEKIVIKVLQQRLFKHLPSPLRRPSITLFKLNKNARSRSDN